LIPAQKRCRTSQEASDVVDVGASPIDFEEGLNSTICDGRASARSWLHETLLCTAIAPQRYLVTSIVMLVQYSGNRDDCSSGAAASDLLAARALGVTMRSIVATYASFAS
jgi:hypothetical protein